jgi:hypothetical protein
MAVGLAGIACATVGWRLALGAPIIHVYRYTDDSGTWDEIECPEKGRDFSMVQANFDEWRRTESRPEARLHRTFRAEREGFLGLAGFDDPAHPRWALPFRVPSVSR